MIVASLLRRRSRMLVALLAIAVGATILSGLVTIYYDVPKQMGEQFRNYGANMLFTASDGEKLTYDEISKAKSLIDENQLVGCAPYRYETATLKLNEDLSYSCIVAGTELNEARKSSPYWVVDGEWPKAEKELLVGASLAGRYSLKKGEKLTLTYGKDEKKNKKGITKTFTVAGILDTGGSEEEYLFVSTKDMQSLTGSQGEYDVAELSVSASQKELEAYSKTISLKAQGVTAKLVKRLTQSENTVLSKLQALVFLVTVIVLLLTMICVATTMMAVVAERRKEVGLRKALGASNGSIIFEFMGEGLMLGAFGGLLGSILGFVFAQMVSINVFNSSITFHFLLVPITIIVSVLVTGLSCMLPVRSAIDIDPALVLKGE